MIKRALWLIVVSFAWLFLARPASAADPMAFLTNWGKPRVLLDVSWKDCFSAGRSTSALWEPEKRGRPFL